MIRTTPDITIADYTVGSTITYEVPEKANKELNIDQAKVWAFRLDDIDEVATDLPLMNKFSADAGEKLKIAIDTECLLYTKGKAAATNRGATAGALSVNINLGVDGTPVVITKANATDLIVDLNTVLDEANIPSENRYVVLPAWYVAMLKKSDLKQADLTGDATGVIRTGVVGMVDRTKVIQSNLLPKGVTTTDGFYCFAGTKEGMTFATQLTKTETLRIPDSFGDYMRGLAVYGREVVQPTAIAEGFFQKG